MAHYDLSILGPKTLLQLLRPLHSLRNPQHGSLCHLEVHVSGDISPLIWVISIVTLAALIPKP